MKKIFIIIIFVTAIISCKEKNSENPSEKNMTAEFISRLHTPELETDHYKILGATSFEKHINDFNKINWEKDYWNAYESDNFNMSDLEVFSVTDSKYLSIGTVPNEVDSFQFFIGLGTHTETNDPNNPVRKIELYYTETENIEIPKKFLKLFFGRDYSKIKKELNQYDMDEIEDVYINVE